MTHSRRSWTGSSTHSYGRSLAAVFALAAEGQVNRHCPSVVVRDRFRGPTTTCGSPLSWKHSAVLAAATTECPPAESSSNSRRSRTVSRPSGTGAICAAIHVRLGGASMAASDHRCTRRRSGGGGASRISNPACSSIGTRPTEGDHPRRGHQMVAHERALWHHAHERAPPTVVHVRACERWRARTARE